VPNDPAAQEAGAQLGTQTYTTDPAATVSARFSETFSGGGGQQPVPPVLPPQALPSPLTSDEVSKIFSPLMQQIDADKKIPNQPLPPPTPALATFLSVLAGSLGAQLTKDPRVEESVIRNLQENTVRRQAIEDQNYANDLMFNREKANRRIAATGQMLEAKLKVALDNQDAKTAMVLQGNLRQVRRNVRRDALVQGLSELLYRELLVLRQSLGPEHERRILNDLRRDGLLARPLIEAAG
jgi:hypothetical protein